MDNNNSKNPPPPPPEKEEPESSDDRHERELVEFKYFMRKRDETMKAQENTIERLHRYPPTFPTALIRTSIVQDTYRHT